MLIVDNEYRCRREHHAQHGSQKQQSAVQAVIILPVGLPAVHGDGAAGVTDAFILPERMERIAHNRIPLLLGGIQVKIEVPAQAGQTGIRLPLRLVQVPCRFFIVRYDKIHGPHQISKGLSSTDLAVRQTAQGVGMARHGQLRGLVVHAVVLDEGLPRLQSLLRTGQAVVIVQRHQRQSTCNGRIGKRIRLVEQERLVPEHAGSGAGPVFHDIFRLQAPFFQLLHDGRTEHLLLPPQVFLGPRLIIDQFNIQLPGIALREILFDAAVQGDGGGGNDQHHSGQNTDGSQACTVALHPVGHGGHGDKVAGFIIITLALLQQTAQGHGPGYEQQVGSRNDQQHRHKEPGHGQNGVLDGHSQMVSRRQ